MTQEEYNDIVISLATKGVTYAETTCDFRRQSDPDSLRRETEYIMFRNIISALQNYDITSGILEDEEVSYLVELAEQILTICPDQGVLANQWFSDPIIPLDGILVTSILDGTITLNLAGSGDVNINWGDGTSTIHTLQAYNEYNPEATEVYHVYNGEEYTLTIDNEEGLTRFAIYLDEATAVVVPVEFVNLEYILIGGDGITEFETHKEWINLKSFFITTSQISSIVTHKEWTALEQFACSQNLVTSVETHKEWIKLKYFLLQNSFIESIQTHKEWVDLELIGVPGSDSITTLETHIEWTKLDTISCAGSGLLSLTTYKEWTLLQILNLSYTNISTIILHQEWTVLRQLDVSNTNISSLIIFTSMTNLQSLSVNGDDIADATLINNILITLDTIGRISGTYDFRFGLNAAPTGAGLTAKNNLISRGCTVLTK